MADVHQQLYEIHGIRLPEDCVSELLYADDTLLLGAHAQTIERQLQCIVEVGAEYGMEMNWKKVEMMNAKCQANIKRQTETLSSRRHH